MMIDSVIIVNIGATALLGVAILLVMKVKKLQHLSAECAPLKSKLQSVQNKLLTVNLELEQEKLSNERLETETVEKSNQIESLNTEVWAKCFRIK